MHAERASGTRETPDRVPKMRAHGPSEGSRSPSRLLLGLLLGLVMVVLVVVGGVAWVLLEGLYRPGLTTHQCVGIAYQVASNLQGEEPPTEAQLAEAVQNIRESWNVFVRNGQGQLVDAWGTPFCVTVVRDGDHYKIVVRSAGPDRTMGNNDDFLYDSLFLKPRERQEETWTESECRGEHPRGTTH